MSLMTGMMTQCCLNQLTPTCFGTQDATTLRQVNGRPVLTRRKEAGGLLGAVLGGLGGAPQGLINETCLQEHRHRRRAHTHYQPEVTISRVP